jgi:hypothetical protein
MDVLKKKISPWFIVEEQEYKVYKLNIDLYRLKQAHHKHGILELTLIIHKMIFSYIYMSMLCMWNLNLKEIFCLFAYLFIDDIIFTGNNPSIIN